MKILQINNHYETFGGAEVVYNSSIKLLRENGHRVFTLSRSKDGFKVERDNYLLGYSKSWLDRFYSSEAKELLIKIILQHKPDIAHFHNIVGGITFSILPVLKKHNIPIVSSIHDFRLLCPTCHFIDARNNECEKCSGGKYYKCVTTKCSSEGSKRDLLISSESYLRDLFIPFKKYIDKYIFVSEYAKNKFLDVHPEIINKSSVLYNCTNIQNPNCEKGGYFLYFGRLIKEKGLLTLLEVFKNKQELSLKIAGDGALANEIVSLKSSNVEMLGYKTGKELSEIIAGSSFVIIPSECGETNSLVALESYALGKPVIASNMGALPELVKPGITGFIFNSKDVWGLSDIIEKCSVMEKEEYASLANKSFEFVKNNFSSDKYYVELLAMYNNILNEKNSINKIST